MPPAATAKTHAADLRFHLRNAEQAAFRAEAEAPSPTTYLQARRLREALVQLKQRAAELEQGMRS